MTLLTATVFFVAEVSIVANKPTRGICCRCHEELDADSIFHWSPGSWSVWCFYCYKGEHYDNLMKLQKGKNDPRET